MSLVSVPASIVPMFRPVPACWVCHCTELARYHECRFDFTEYARQDPELHAYTGLTVWLVRCGACHFGQPELLPTLPNFFDRMYDQRWSDEWVEREFDASYKDFIFRSILRALPSRMKTRSRRLLDIGAHAGRFMHVAQRSGWEVEGIELNPRTAAYAARRTGAPVYRANAHSLALEGHRYSAVTLTDVLEHIPEPLALLTTVATLIEPGGVVAVKVPCGPGQWRKERVLAALVRSHAVSIADNLVHVNHFSPRSLRLALERAGFSRVVVRVGAPELASLRPMGIGSARRALSNAVRLGVYAAAAAPGGVHSPFALNLQAYATKGH